MKYNSLFIWVIILLISSCFKRSENSSKIFTLTISDSRLVNDIRLSDFVADISLIPLETDSNCLIGEWKKSETMLGKIVVCDSYISSAVFVFDSVGNFLFPIGRKGEAPDEYIFPMDITLDRKGNRIFVLDGQRRQVKEYSMKDGHFIKSIKIDFASAQMSFHNGKFLFAGSGFEDRIVITDDYFKREESHIPYHLMNRKAMLEHFTETQSNGLLFRLNLNDTIYKFDDTGFGSHLFIDFGSSAFTRSVFNELNPTNQQKLDDLLAYKTNIKYFAENDNWIYFVYFKSNIPYFVLYNKPLGVSKIFSIYDAINDVTYEKYPFLIQTSEPDGSFIGSVEWSQKLMDNLESKGDDNNPFKFKMKAATRSFNEFSNPIFFRISFK